MNIGKGVASRWQGRWKILETTHTIDSRGYTTEGVLGRIPYEDDSSKKSADSGNKSDSGNKASGANSGKSGTSGGTWKMSSDGTWRKT